MWYKPLENNMRAALLNYGGCEVISTEKGLQKESFILTNSFLCCSMAMEH